MGSRCKACDAILGPYEVIWRPCSHSFEELCRKCRNTINEVYNGELQSTSYIVDEYTTYEEQENE